MFPPALMLGGSRVGELTITASGGAVRWTATAFGVSLSAWSGALGARQSATIIVSALDGGGTGWVLVQPGALYVQVTWPATPTQAGFPY